ncbi:Hypothetical protein PBC10988_0630 [Planctomycetales bacterium 10988]|nr:Hypothetical protein PBC10988_0630 [Planctomycetales bacterium 10988]
MKQNSYLNTTKINRVGFTLIELLIVILIIAALAAMIVPRLSGISTQTSSAVNASIVADVNNAVGLYEVRYGKHALGWDSLLNSDDELFTKLHPNLVPHLKLLTLDANQSASLQEAGIVGFHDADEARVSAPSDNSTVFRFLAPGTQVVAFEKVEITEGHGSTLIDNAFNINQYQTAWDHEFVVVGLGGPTGLKGTTIREIPIVESADPQEYYARALCVFMIPPTGSTTPFRAQYIGCFLPDGTSSRQNLDDFNQADRPLD